MILQTSFLRSEVYYLGEMEDGIIYFGDDLCETTSFYVIDEEED